MTRRLEKEKRLKLFDQATGHDCSRESHPPIGDGSERNSTLVASLIDTNILVYRFNARYRDKQRVARDA